MAAKLTRFRDQMRAAIANRKSADRPRVTRFITILIALVSSYIALSIVLAPASQVPEFHFVDERGAITVLSAVFLAMGSGFALVSYLLSAAEPPSTRLFWFLMLLAIGFLTMDELLEFHERIGGLLDRWDALGLASGDTFRGWNDIIVICYGVVALFVALFFLPTALSFPVFFELMCVACGFYVIHTAVDTLATTPTTASVMVEESAKLFCSAFIALALLVALLSTIRRAQISTNQAAQGKT
jgi:hypothetical protein